MPDSKTKVCFLINLLAPGGAPTLLLDIVRHSNITEVEYTVCFIEGEDTLAADFEAADARVIDFDAKFKFDPRALARMTWFFRKEDFEVVHAHLPYAQILGRVLSRLGGVQNVVSTQHSLPTNYHPITRTLERITRPLDSRTIAVSEGVERAFTGEAHQYEPGMQRRWCTIYNGIDSEKFNNDVLDSNEAKLTNEFNIDNEFVFLNMSRYTSAKAQHDLIKAMRIVVPKWPNVHLFIVGWGELADELQEAVDQYNLGSHITITGRASSNDVFRFYSLADVFVSSSVREGLPIAHLEAMAAELPVIATDIPGVREVVRDEQTGLLVPPCSPKQLSDAMIRLRESERREKFGNAGYDRVQSEFDIDQTVENHLKLFKELDN